MGRKLPRIEEREGKWWAVLDGERPPRHGPFDSWELAWGRVKQVLGMHVRVEQDALGAWLAVLTMPDGKKRKTSLHDEQAAKVFALQLEQEMLRMLGLTPPLGVEVRDASDGSVLVDFKGQRDRARPRPGGKPGNFTQLLERGLKLSELLTASKLLEDLEPAERQLVLLLIAKGLAEEANEHPLALVSRAREVNAWCDESTGKEQTPLPELEQLGAAAARSVAEVLTPAEQFILLVSNTGDKGHTTWVSSMERSSAINLLLEMGTKMRADEVSRS